MFAEQMSPPDPVNNWKEMTDRAANAIFILEIMKGTHDILLFSSHCSNAEGTRNTYPPSACYSNNG